MLVKLSNETVSVLGVKNASEAQEMISRLASENSQRANAMPETTLADLQSKITALETRLATQEARPDMVAVSDDRMVALMGSDEGKKIIGAEASRIFLEAGAATGTQPAKPSPAPAVADADAVANLIAQGKFAEAFAASETIRSEFVDAESYAGYMKAVAGGQVKLRAARNN